MSKKSEMLEMAASLTTMALRILEAKAQAETVVKTAQLDGWADDDPRWQDAFNLAHQARTAALSRL